MTKRLTAEQVAEDFEAIASHPKLTAEPLAGPAIASIGMCAKAVRYNLVPRWQDEPDAEGIAHWVEGLFDRMPVIVYRSEDGRWLLSGSIPSDRDGEWVDVDGEELGNRRVCPIGERPEDGE